MVTDSLAGSNAGLGLFFVVGLLGGAHCLGMCGPLVTTYADRLGGRDNAVSWREIRGHALFNAGRTASYATIGGLAGLAGGVVFDAAGVIALGDAIRGVVGVGVGLFVVAAGLGYLVSGTNALARFEAGVLSRPFARVYGAITTRVDDWVRGPRIAALGAIHGLLPCPILYPAFLYAFATGSATTGALSLLALGLGTVPALFLYGTAFGAAGETTRRRLHRAMGVAFLAMGYVPIAHGLGLLGVPVPGVRIPIYQPLG